MYRYIVYRYIVYRRMMQPKNREAFTTTTTATTAATTDCTTNGVQAASNIIPSWKYRKYMVDNADNLRTRNFYANVAESATSPTAVNTATQHLVSWDTHTPHIYTSVHDNTTIPGIPNNEIRGRFLSTTEVRLRHATSSLMTTTLPI